MVLYYWRWNVNNINEYIACSVNVTDIYYYHKCYIFLLKPHMLLSLNIKTKLIIGGLQKAGYLSLVEVMMSAQGLNLLITAFRYMYLS